MKLAVGPMLYLWERDPALAFYERLCDEPVDIVYLGETVCAKRRVLQQRDWFEIAQRLTQAGKQVVLSTLALIEAESEFGSLSQLISKSEWLLEANDAAALHELSGSAFVAGPHINVYNQATLAVLARLGARRWVAPVELDLATLEAIQATRPADMETEVFAYGRLPLAFSARCFTARAHNRSKDDCGFVCREYPDGMTLYSQEDKPFLTLNGVQTQSASVHNALASLADLRRIGVDVLRLSPHSAHAVDFHRVIAAFHRAATGETTPDFTMAQGDPPTMLPGGYCDGYLHGLSGMHSSLRE